MILASIFVYLLLIRFPIFSIPFLYATYSEILMAPARNLTFFVYILTGVSFYLCGICLAGLSNRGMIAGALAGATVFFYMVREKIEEVLTAWADLFYFPLILILGILIISLYRRRQFHAHFHKSPILGHPLLQIPEASPNSIRQVSMTALLIILAAIMTFKPDASPLVLSPMKVQSPLFPQVSLPLSSPGELHAALPCMKAKDVPLRVNLPIPATKIENVLSCPPPPDLIEFLKTKIGTGASIATNSFNVYSLFTFSPVQILAWPTPTTFNLRNPLDLAGSFYTSFMDALAKKGTQPFFNSIDRPDERKAFLQKTGATHVVIDPMYYGSLTPILKNMGTLVELIYEQDEWAVFVVNKSVHSP